MLFVVGAVFSIYEGVHRIMHPQALVSPVVAFAVLGVAILLEGVSLRTAIKESNRSRGRAGWTSFIRHAKAPELPAVLLEDVAALSGLLLALIGVTVATLTHEEAWDGAGSVAIGLLLAVVAFVLATEMKSLLIGESASADIEAAIVTAVEAGPEVQRVIHLRTLHIGPETLLVAAKIGVVHDDTAASVVAGIDAAERRIRVAVPIAELIFLEPDIYQAARADPEDPAVIAARRRSRRIARSAAATQSGGEPRQTAGPAGRSDTAGAGSDTPARSDTADADSDTPARSDTADAGSDTPARSDTADPGRHTAQPGSHTDDPRGDRQGPPNQQH